MLEKIDHIGIAVQRLEDAIPFYEKALGLKCERVEEIPGQKVRTAFFPVGEVCLELLEPTTEDSPVAKFLKQHGEGVHHVAFQSDDLTEQLALAKAGGAHAINEIPTIGAGGKQVLFLHPKTSHGVLTELCSELVKESPTEQFEANLV
ncbi:MAG: methylmalonyl-CoA epimerase [Myxococcota bacterium]|jgi:methylmalonyl-CoA epimerase|nr:methylmalonyl-CoA epimerase [Myxococcota bacterium]